MADLTYKIDRGAPRPDPNMGSIGLAALAQTQNGAAANDEDDGGLTTSDGNLRIEIGEDGEVYFEQTAPAIKRPRSTKFEENLAETEPEGAINNLAFDYAEGVEQDIQSRSDFIENRNKGIDLLGLKIEDAASGRGSRQSISKVRHPALLKACLMSRAGACAELLPATGPAKIATIGGSDSHEDELARNFEDDFNYYLTDVAREFYPDTRRAMFYRAFDGSVYKKVYRCPLRRRPVSESVYMPDLIVGEDALDLTTAQRKTNEITMWPMQVQRMMLRGGWKNVNLAPSQDSASPSRQKENMALGFSSASRRPEDRPYTFWEGYTSIIPSEYGIHEPDAPEGMPLPYRIVIEKATKTPVALYRNWRKGDEDFREREVFVKYGLVPGLGFLDYGMVHLIGNSTRVLTTILQVMCDRGMLANFPGGIKVKGLKTESNELSPGLGEFVSAQLPDGMDDIRKSLMGMPYGDISAIFIQLMESVAKDVEVLAGTMQIEFGEGRTNMPVGTILAMIEQQTRPQTEVHRADHQSQKHELCLLRDLFIEHPEDLRWLTRKSGRQWRAVEEFSDMDLVPASDPNVPSQTHRVMLNMFLADQAEKFPQLFGPKLVKVAARVLHGVGINDAEDMMMSPTEAAAAWQNQQQNAAQNPAMMKAQMEMPLKAAELQLEQKKLVLKEQESRRQAANEAADHQQRAQKLHSDAQLATMRLANEQAKAIAEHRAQLAESTPDPETMSNLRLRDAQGLAALASAAVNLAKAGQTVKEGEQELSTIQRDIETGD